MRSDASSLPVTVLGLALLAGCETPDVVVVPLPAPERRVLDAGPGAGGALQAAYTRWVAAHEAGGGDRNVVLALGWSKALSVEPTKAVGRLVLDLIEGASEVEVLGLEDPGRAEVWLVDNQPGAGLSARAEPGDGLFLLGRLELSGERARLAGGFGPAPPDGFEVDLVVVSRPGGHPGQRGVLFGSPSLFQREYTRRRVAPRVATPASRERLPAPSFDPLVAAGASIFFNETFAGNGRTCGTCHPAENNFTIDPRFIATLPARDPLFVAERDPALRDLERPALLRELGLVLENVDGFGDLETNFVLRGVPHTLALSTSLRPGADGTAVRTDQRLGWGGDGAPGSGSLREFAIGAVAQHFTRTLRRAPGVDFRLPTDGELDALEAFQLTLGRVEDPDLGGLRLKGAQARRGLEIFLAGDTERGTAAAGKCNLCHANGGATVSFAPGGLNFNFDTGVERLSGLPADLVPPGRPQPDGGLGREPRPGGGFGDGTFNTPPLVEAADTGPFFHNNAVGTIEEAVAFYGSRAFNESPAGRFLASVDTGRIGIRLEPTEVAAVAAFLRVLNSLENIRRAVEIDRSLLSTGGGRGAEALRRVAIAEEEDAAEVLAEASLHLEAVRHLKRAAALDRRALAARGALEQLALTRQALAALAAARAEILDEPAEAAAPRASPDPVAPRERGRSRGSGG